MRNFIHPWYRYQYMFRWEEHCLRGPWVLWKHQAGPGGHWGMLHQVSYVTNTLAQGRILFLFLPHPCFVRRSSRLKLWNESEGHYSYWASLYIFHFLQIKRKIVISSDADSSLRSTDFFSLAFFRSDSYGCRDTCYIGSMKNDACKKFNLTTNTLISVTTTLCKVSLSIVIT